MLVSTKYLNFIYIGNMMSVRNIIKKNHSGVGSVYTEPLYIRLYSIFAYIRGFDSKNIYYYRLKDYGKK